MDYACRIIDNENKILVDLIQPTFFRTRENEIGLFDELKSAKEFAQKLTDNGVTLSFLTRGKKVITLGKYAKPEFSYSLHFNIHDKSYS
ncbi:MAG: hypothetical protein WAM14_02445 [Candidatus Nitrosopolaris sp.]